MSLLVALGISIGVLAGIWGQFAGNIGMIGWVGFMSWACFYAAGGKTDGLIKTLACNLTGVIYGVLIVLLAGALGTFPFALGVALLIFVFCMCVQAHVSYLSFIPGTVVGTASFVGAGGTTDLVVPVAVSLIIGAILGWISEFIAGAMAKSPESKAE